MIIIIIIIIIMIITIVIIIIKSLLLLNMQKLEKFSFALLLPHARESGFQNLGNFLLGRPGLNSGLWNPEYTSRSTEPN